MDDTIHIVLDLSRYLLNASNFEICLRGPKSHVAVKVQTTYRYMDFPLQKVEYLKTFHYCFPQV